VIKFRSFRQLFGMSVYTTVPKGVNLFMSLALFTLLICGYFVFSYVRHVDNPDDKLVPGASMMYEGLKGSITPDRNGDRLLLACF
jgi:hypothetical protein